MPANCECTFDALPEVAASDGASLLSKTARLRKLHKPKFESQEDELHRGVTGGGSQARLVPSAVRVLTHNVRVPLPITLSDSLRRLPKSSCCARASYVSSKAPWQVIYAAPRITKKHGSAARTALLSKATHFAGASGIPSPSSKSGSEQQHSLKSLGALAFSRWLHVTVS